ncbi:type II secretion system F family protein [Pseudoalteromonas sp.]|uniref:type II secretion system F family protein n=1 Tax=Pseudoalteromonas sp. TaxID=53249 RepID=UPI003565A80A
MIVTWLDLTLFSLFAISSSLFFLLQTGKINTAKKANVNEQLKLKNSIFYPAKWIRQAGITAKKSPLLYWALKLSLTLGALALFFELPAFWQTLKLQLILVLIGFFGCDLWIYLKRNKRQQQIDDSIEFFISLMIVYLQSGFSLSQAFANAAEHGIKTNNPLSFELNIIASELRSGRERHIAFNDLHARTGIASLHKLATIINIGSAVGAPVIDSLKAQLSAVKAQQSKKIDDQISKKSLETMLPMMLVCLPMFFVLVFFPAAMQIMDVLQLLVGVL